MLFGPDPSTLRNQNATQVETPVPTYRKSTAMPRKNTARAAQANEERARLTEPPTPIDATAEPHRVEAEVGHHLVNVSTLEWGIAALAEAVLMLGEALLALSANAARES